MKAFLKRLITPGSFASSIATLSSGTGLGQLIMFGSSPVLMRLYEPAVFGDLAILMSLTMIFSTIFTLRFEMAIPLPEKDEDAHELVSLSLIIVVALSSLTWLSLLLFQQKVLSTLNLETLGIWILILPVTIVNEAAINILGFWFIRRKKYMIVALSRTLNSGSMVVIQIVLAPLVLHGQTGLVVGFAAGQVIPLVYLLVKYIDSSVALAWKNLTWRHFKGQISTYRQFPLFASWNAAFNTISRQIPPVIIAYFFSKELVGQYAIALRMLNMPFNLIGTAVGQVYYQRVSSLIRARDSIRKFTYSTMLKAGGVILFPLIAILFLGPTIFGIVLGRDWIMAGTISQILVPIYLVRFMVSPVSNLFAATQTQQKMTGWQLALMLTSILTFYFGGLQSNFLMTIELYSGLTTILYMVLGLIIRYTIRNYEQSRTV